MVLRAWRMARFLVPAVLLVVAWSALHDRVRAHPYFALRDVVVVRRGHLTEEAVVQHAGVRVGAPIWDVDVEAVQARLLELPWVRSARVRRELPDRIVIRVREYRPAAIVRIAGADHPLYYVAADGRIFAPVDRRDGRDLPYLSGLERADLDGGTGRGAEAIREGLAALAAVAEQGRTLGAISEVYVNPGGGGVTIVPTSPAIPIHLGRGGYAAKLARLAEILPRWVDRQDEVRSVNCEFEDQVIVRLRRAGGVGA
jgi:cell division protein FtsQ